MKHIKYAPDTYLLYGVSNPPYPVYPVRLRVYQFLSGHL